jgi:hypothetical protein
MSKNFFKSQWKKLKKSFSNKVRSLFESHRRKTLEDRFDHILKKSKNEGPISVAEILHILSGKGKPLILIFLALPFCQPIPLPGVSIPFGIVIAIIGFHMLFSDRVWAPKFIMEKKISHRTLNKIIPKGLWLIDKINHFSHSRITWLCYPRICHILNGLLIAFWGLFLALPVPIPVTNLVAGWSILLLSLGMLENDGLFVLIVYTFTVGCILFITLFAVPYVNSMHHNTTQKNSTAKIELSPTSTKLVQ